MFESFSNRCVKENTAVTLDAGSVHFSARGSVTLVPGWRAVFNHTDEPNEKDEDETTALPVLAEGEALPVREIEVRKSRPSPDRCIQRHLYWLQWNRAGKSATTRKNAKR